MNEHRVMKILLAPLLSEKSTQANSNNQYVFQVARDATKPEIKVAVEQLFNVKVLAVQVVNMKPRNVRFGRIEGKSKAWKKAYVRLAEGNNIDFTGA